MIPPEDSAFQSVEMSADSLHHFGFESQAELNSFRYSDYCFKTFMEAAQKEKYFHNTIFVFIGDHGVSGNAEAVYPAVWTDQRLTDEHVPFLFYAPFLLEPQLHNEVVSQIDVLPTVAGLIHQPFLNSTLGRNVLDSSRKNDFAFVIHHDEGRIGVITDSFYYEKNINFPDEQLISLNGQPLLFSKRSQDSIKAEMSSLTTGFYETSKWMLMNNK
jgi:phosphoglycerol transferase MdoB-like AlkP superfamily enzyme